MQLLSNRLKSLLESHQMSYQQLADITHISKATLHRYCNGYTNKIPIERIWPIAYALDTTPQYLMGDTDDPSPAYIGHNLDTTTSNGNTTFSLIWHRCRESEKFNDLMNEISTLKDENILPVSTFIHMLQKEGH